MMVKWLVALTFLAACGDNLVTGEEAAPPPGVTAVVQLPPGEAPPVLTEPFVAEVARAYCDYLQACFPDKYADYAGIIDCIHTKMRDLVLPAAPTEQCMQELLDASCGSAIVIPDSCADYGL